MQKRPKLGTERKARTSDPARGVLPPDFEAWYRDHRSVVYRFVRFRVGTREAAEDVTSDVFMKALRSLERYDPTRAAPRTWLLRIAQNAVTDHLRSLKRKGSLHVSLDRVPDLVGSGQSPEERLIREERLNRILNASQTLKPGDQELISLRYGAGLGNAEIAEAMQISSNAVAVRLHRALGRLKDAVHDQTEIEK
jgi:RNA polymerase sigma-70 factor (ECF subfamily)